MFVDRSAHPARRWLDIGLQECKRGEVHSKPTVRRAGDRRQWRHRPMDERAMASRQSAWLSAKGAIRKTITPRLPSE